jgi:hypothetical protein
MEPSSPVGLGDCLSRLRVELSLDIDIIIHLYLIN